MSKPKTAHFREPNDAARFVCGVVVKPEATYLGGPSNIVALPAEKRCKTCLKHVRAYLGDKRND